MLPLSRLGEHQRLSEKSALIDLGSGRYGAPPAFAARKCFTARLWICDNRNSPAPNSSPTSFMVSSCWSNSSRTCRSRSGSVAIARCSSSFCSPATHSVRGTSSGGPGRFCARSASCPCLLDSHCRLHQFLLMQHMRHFQQRRQPRAQFRRRPVVPQRWLQPALECRLRLAQRVEYLRHPLRLASLSVAHATAPVGHRSS
jgi:hypothetical protein